MGTKKHSNYESLITFTRASAGHALRPVSYGDQLVTNGDFSTDSDWTKSGGSTISGGEGHVVSTGSFVSLIQDIGAITGKIYFVTIDVTVNSGAGVYIGIGGGSVDSRRFEAPTTGSYAVAVVAGSTDTNIQITRRAATDTDVDNVSVKEVTFDESDGTLTLFEHPDNIPRVEYDSAGNRLGLLVEEARTNLVTYSENLTLQWNKQASSSITAVVNSAVSPDGTETANTLQEQSSGTDSARYFPNYRTVTQNQATTLSAFMKKGTSDYGFLSVRHSSGNVAGAEFNLNTGVVATTYDAGACTLDGSSITDIGNGWYRCTVTVTCTSATVTNGYYFVGIGHGTGIGAGGYPTGTLLSETIYAWGVQVEAGSFPTSYIKSNSGSTTTRSADVAGMNTADFGFNADGMTVLIEADSFATGTGSTNSLLSISDGTTNNRFSVRVNYAQSWHTSGTSNGNLDYTNVGSTTSKVIYTIDDASQAATIDGASVLQDTSVTMPTGLSELWIGSYYNGANYYLNGHIKSIKYYPRRLTNAQLQDLTS